MQQHNKAPKVGASWLQSREKRLYDIVFASGALLLSMPVIAAAVLANVVADGQNPFFVQKRLGEHGRKFSIYKIRTLKGTHDYKTPGFGVDDERATKVGKFLRKYAIDEFPQFLNVLKGDMSIVGTRPVCESDIDVMREALTPEEFENWEATYSASKPGIVSSYVLKTRLEPFPDRSSPEHYHERVLLDQSYAETASPTVDRQLCLGGLAIINY